MPAGFCLANTFQNVKDDRSNLESVHPTPAIANALTDRSFASVTFRK